MSAFSQEVEAFKTHPLEYARLTGRTTNMLNAAKAVAESGRPVVVIFKDMRTVESWQRKFGSIKNMSLIPMKVKMPELDWNQLKITEGIHKHSQTFIDHDVIYLYHKDLFKAYHAYDRPMDHSPYTTPQQPA